MMSRASPVALEVQDHLQHLPQVGSPGVTPPGLQLFKQGSTDRSRRLIVDGSRGRLERQIQRPGKRSGLGKLRGGERLLTQAARVGVRGAGSQTGVGAGRGQLL